MIKKFNLTIFLSTIGILIFVAVMMYGFYSDKFTFLQKKTQNISVVQTEEEEKIKRTDYTEVARKTLDWIDKQRNEDGWYILERGCDFEKKTCDTVWDNEEGNKDGLIATWARLNFYEQHKNPKDLEIVKKDIDLFYDKYKDNNLKDSLWICKITYEMAQSKYIDQGQKGKLKELCFNAQFPTPKETEIIRKNNSSRLEGISKQKEIWKSWEGYNLVMRGLNVYYGYPLEEMSRYLWEGNTKHLLLAKEYFEIAQKQVETFQLEKTYRLRIEDRCSIGLSGLGIYQLGDKDVKYLNYARDIFEEFIIKSEESIRATTPICGLLVKKMYQLTAENKYMTNLEFISRILDEYYSDSEINKITSDGAFYKANTGRIFTGNKNVVENGLILELIRN